LIISNRDTEGFYFDLRFDPDTFRWDFIGNSTEGGDDVDALCFTLDEFLQDEWSGTATELCNALKSHDPNFPLVPSTLGKELLASIGLLKKDYGIIYDRDRSNKSKQIFLRRAEQ
jgi:hypothetical protein